MIVARGLELRVGAEAEAVGDPRSSRISKTTTTMSSKALATLSLTLVTCARPTGVAPEVEARTIWEGRCVNCHGPGGRGDGPAGLATSPRPRDFTDPEWQRQTSDGQIRAAILYGGAAAGLNPVMAANPDLQDRPKVTQALVGIIRGWAIEAAGEDL